jgi:DNA-binding GntR family transcriptional regulator
MGRAFDRTAGRSGSVTVNVSDVISTFRTKADLVYDHVRRKILNGKLRPGDHGPINQVARELGVSDIPAREGVRCLEAVGLLTLTTPKGAVVRHMGRLEVEETLAIRTELEALALRGAAAHITAAELAKLRPILDAMADSERGGRLDEYGELNREFHMCAYSVQPYRRPRSMIETLWDATDWCRRLFTHEAESSRASLAEHESIYDALQRGDGEAACAFLPAQKQRAGAWLLRQIEVAEDAASPEHHMRLGMGSVTSSCSA